MSVTLDEALGRYGQETQTETLEIISSKLQQLDIELANIPDTKKSKYLLAVKKCPDQCDDNFKLQHLRSEVFRVNDAAKRIIAYWDKRVEIFGEDKAFLPLNLSENGPFRDDEKALAIGLFRPTQQKDDGGRAMVFYNPARLPLDKSYDRKSLVRVFWYILHAVLEDEEVQKNGVVFIVCLTNFKRSQFDRHLTKLNAGSTKDILPIRVSAIHVCDPPIFFKVIFTLVKLFLGERIRKRVRVHGGSVDDIISTLSTKFGIEKAQLPSEMGGGNVLDHVKWLDERRAKGL